MTKDMTPEYIKKNGDLIYEEVFTAYGEGEPLVCSENTFAMATTIGLQIWLYGESLFLFHYANNEDNIIDMEEL